MDAVAHVSRAGLGFRMGLWLLHGLNSFLANQRAGASRVFAIKAYIEGMSGHILGNTSPHEGVLHGAG
jgi:hypothetical protein